MKRSITVAIVVGALGFAPAGPAGAQQVARIDCAGLSLHDASGVPDGQVRAYRFRGICKLYQGIASAMAGGPPFATPWAEVELRWDPKTAILQNGIRLEDPTDKVVGTATLVFKCTADPVLGPASCAPSQFDDETGWFGFQQYWEKGLPIKGATTLADAAALSAKHAAAPPPPPPPPPPKQTIQSMEGALPTKGVVDSARVRANVARAAARAAPPAPPAGGAAATPEPPEAGFTPLALSADARFELENGRVLAARAVDGALRWTILGADEEVLRTFPEGSTAFQNAVGDILVDWGGGVFPAGRARPVHRTPPVSRLRLPACREAIPLRPGEQVRLADGSFLSSPSEGGDALRLVGPDAAIRRVFEAATACADQAGNVFVRHRGGTERVGRMSDFE